MSARRSPVIGLVGGIGSGKSSVARALGELGCLVIDSDEQARAILRRPEVRDELVSWWGPGVLGPDGSIDRGAVAKIVFGSDDERARLEQLIHPLIALERAAIMAERGASARAIVLDAPLLIEAGLDAQCDVVVFVDAPESVREQRVSGRGWDAGELKRRASVQVELESKRRRADMVLVNDSTREDLVRRVAALLSEIERGWVAARPGGGG